MARRILLVFIMLVLLGTLKITQVPGESDGKNYRLNNTSAPEIVKILQEKFSNVSPQPKIEIDEHRNSLTVTADSETQKKIEELIKQLDVQLQQMLIESKWVRTPKENLAVELYEPDSGFMTGTSLCKNEKDCFKDPGKVDVLANPHLKTLDGMESKSDLSHEIYGISDASVDENGDIICKIKKFKEGISFKVLPKMSKESPDIITVSYEIELNAVVGRVPPAISAIAGIKELGDLWCPIINTRSIGSTVKIRTGQTIVLGGISKSEPTGGIILPSTQGMVVSEDAKSKNESDDIMELVLLTVKKVETGSGTGISRIAKPVIIRE